MLIWLRRDGSWAEHRYPDPMRYVVILAGGSGKRLWPLSRKGMPKQLLKLVGDRSLLRIAFDRLESVVPPNQIFVCTGADFADVVAAELPEMPVENILGEPMGRDSLNAVAWPAAVIAERDPDAVIAMVAADHIIRPEREFAAAVNKAFEVAEGDGDALVTFGVVPTAPHTGYGYLQRGADVDGYDGVCEVAQFREKPDWQTAEKYVSSGDYWWNSGMFVWQAKTVLAQIEALVPDCHKIVTELAAHPERLHELFGRLPKISVDYAIMEPVSQGRGSAHVLAVRLPITWHDIGGFNALAHQMQHDDSGNAVRGSVAILDGLNNLVINSSNQTLVATVGLRDMVVIQTDDITMVCPRTDSERVKDLVALSVDDFGEEFA